MNSSVIAEVLGSAVEALRKIKNYPGKLIAASICDIFFFFVYGFITAPLFGKILDHIIAIGSIVSEQAPQVVRSANPALSTIVFSDPQASSLLTRIVILFLIVAAAVYIIYSLFQGISWKLSSDISGRKTQLNDYLKGFAYVNIFWMALFIIQHILSLFSDVRESAFERFQVEPSAVFPTFVIVLLFVIFYFALISYALKGKPKERIKNSFRIGIKKIGYLLPAYGVIAIVYFVFKILLDALVGVDFNLMVIVGILTIIPAMTWARVYLTLVVEKIK